MTTDNNNDRMSKQGQISELLARQREILEQIARPYVVVDVYPRRYVNALYFRVRNVGQTPAFEISVEPQEGIRVGGELSSDLSIFNEPIGVLGKGDEISFFLGTAATLLNDKDAVLQFDVKLKYADSKGKWYDEKISIDIDLLRGLAIELPVADSILVKFDQMRRDMDKIARYAQMLRHRQLREEAERAEEETSKSVIGDGQEDNAGEGE